MARRGPAKRLLIVPALLVAVIVVGVHLVRDATPREPAPHLRVAGIAPAAGEPVACGRPADAEVLRQIRAEVDARGRVTSQMVLACPAAYDGLAVRYVGELVGDLLLRDGGAWVTVNDDDYALEVGPLGAHDERRGVNTGLTVWLPDDLLVALSGLGDPSRRGDVVEVVGRIERTDPADGGGLTLRAQRLTVLSPAVAVDDPFEVAQAALALGALGAGAALYGLRRRAARR